jgi:hypothetical protein
MDEARFLFDAVKRMTVDVTIYFAGIPILDPNCFSRGFPGAADTRWVDGAAGIARFF